MKVTDRLNTIDSAIKVFNPDLYIPPCTLQMYVSTATTERCHRNAASYATQHSGAPYLYDIIYIYAVLPHDTLFSHALLRM